MTLTDLTAAIDSMQAQPQLEELRSTTYLLTYPSIRALANAEGDFDVDRFNQLAAMVYGWMPRVVRIDTACLEPALVALNGARQAQPNAIQIDQVTALAQCIRSVVGASKMLHFVNANVFPIWDSRIESFRLGNHPPYGQMNNAQNYLKYVAEVHAIREEPDFPVFYNAFCEAMRGRLDAIGVDHYPITEVRAIEAAAFELAP